MTTASQATFPGFQFPNTTQIPNEVFDSLMSKLSGGELKVLLYICRRTFGFRKDSDSISLTQIAHGITTKAGRVLDQGTGLSKRQVQRALRALEGRQVIQVERKVDETGLHEVNTYRLNVRGSEKMSPPVETSVSGGVGTPLSGGVETPASTTKQREQKKEEQNKDTDVDAVARDLENFGMTKSAVTSLINRYPAAYIREKLALTHDLLDERSTLVTKNPVGWLRRAIEEDYKPPRTTKRPTPISGRKRLQRTGTPKEHEREQPIVTPPVELPQPDKQTEGIWQQTVEHLKHTLSSEETADRLTGTTLIEVTDRKAVISVPDRFAIAWFERRLYSQIAKGLRAVLGRDVDLQFIACS